MKPHSDASAQADMSSTVIKGGVMHRDELMKADLLSEIVLLGSGLVILVALLMALVVAMTSASAA